MLLTGALLADPRTREQIMNPQGPIHKVLPGIPGITQGIFSRPTTAPIADTRSPREIAESRGTLLTNLVGDISNLPGIRNTPLGMAGSFMPLVSKILNPTPYVY